MLISILSMGGKKMRGKREAVTGVMGRANGMPEDPCDSSSFSFSFPFSFFFVFSLSLSLSISIY